MTRSMLTSKLIGTRRRRPWPSPINAHGQASKTEGRAGTADCVVLRHRDDYHGSAVLLPDRDDPGGRQGPCYQANVSRENLQQAGDLLRVPKRPAILCRYGRTGWTSRGLDIETESRGARGRSCIFPESDSGT